MHGLTRYILALCLLVAPALADEGEEEAAPGNHVTERDRLWVNFMRESAVVGDGKLRLAVQTLAINKSTSDRTPDLTGFPVDDLEKALEIAGTPDRVRNVEGLRFDLVGSYGLGPYAELGFDMPFFSESIKFEGDTPTRNTEDVGDLVIYTKFRKMVADNTSIGGGLELSVPTGAESKRLGTGELAFNPFVNARHTWGRIAVGGHLGFNISEGDVPDVFNYSTFVIARGTDLFALRVELNGRFFRDFDTDFNDVSLWPGIDLNVTERITVRPQALVNLTNDAWEWGIGAGVVVDLF
jgi:hypothetical protein